MRRTSFASTIVLALFFASATLTLAEDSVTKTPKQLLEERKALLEQKKKEIKDLAEQKKASIEARRKEVKDKDKLAALRDEKKKALVSRIEEKMANVNKNRSDHFLKFLDRLSKVLDKIGARADKFKAEGVDVSAVTEAISKARAMIATAQAAVQTQMSKSYSVTPTSDETAKGEVGKAMSGLEADLKAVKSLVQAANTAVHDAFLALSKLRGTITPKSELSPTP